MHARPPPEAGPSRLAARAVGSSGRRCRAFAAWSRGVHTRAPTVWPPVTRGAIVRRIRSIIGLVPAAALVVAAVVAATGPSPAGAVPSADLVISQVYGGGGNTGAPYNAGLRRGVQRRRRLAVAGRAVGAVRLGHRHGHVRCVGARGPARRRPRARWLPPRRHDAGRHRKPAARARCHRHHRHVRHGRQGRPGHRHDRARPATAAATRAPPTSWPPSSTSSATARPTSSRRRPPRACPTPPPRSAPPPPGAPTATTTAPTSSPSPRPPHNTASPAEPCGGPPVNTPPSVTPNPFPIQHTAGTTAGYPVVATDDVAVTDVAVDGALPAGITVDAGTPGAVTHDHRDGRRHRRRRRLRRSPSP